MNRAQRPPARRPEGTSGDEIRIVYDRAGFPGPHRHSVRSTMEAEVCAWLLRRGIAHRHAAEVFAVRLGPRKRPAVYVPDIILHDRRADGRLVIIEPHAVHVPKEGGTRLLAAFRRQYGSRVFLTVVARHQDRGTIDAGAADLIVDLRDLDSLAPHLPIPR